MIKKYFLNTQIKVLLMTEKLKTFSFLKYFIKSRESRNVLFNPSAREKT